MVSRSAIERKRMIPRDITPKLHSLLESFPVVFLTGPRQSGKSTLLKSEFPHHTYVTLEDVALLERAKDDPRGFLSSLGEGAIIDEAQRFPELFSYIQVAVDEANRPGMFVLSGSQNFLMMEQITQSLAGRVGILKLLPFSYHEIENSKNPSPSIDAWLFGGGYPRIYDWGIDPADYYPNYIQTYVERDVRQLRNVGNVAAFIRFVRMCAGRIGQMLNLSDLADSADVSRATAQTWLSILEASYIVFMVRPYHRNYGKRLVKSPKLYFYDTGLACSLLGMNTVEQVATYYQRGSLFENMIMAEFYKHEFAAGLSTDAYYWRDNHKLELDLMFERGLDLFGVEIKASQTAKLDHFKTLHKVGDIVGIDPRKRFVVFGSDESALSFQQGGYISWRKLFPWLGTLDSLVPGQP